jgi:hypothetical protein
MSRLLEGLRVHAPDDTQVVVVLNDPSETQQAALALGSSDRAAIGGREVEILRTSSRLGHAAALNIALRRGAGEMVLLADGSAWPTGDALGPLAEALGDQHVAIAGAFGVGSTEPGKLRPAALATSTEREVVALLAGWMAFRRADYIALGPLDERYVTSAWLDIWLSLRLRAGADPDWTETAEPETAEVEPAEYEAQAVELSAIEADAVEGDAIDFELAPPRRAVRLDLQLGRDELLWPPDRSRLNRRNMYRVLDRWGWREDLV